MPSRKKRRKNSPIADSFQLLEARNLLASLANTLPVGVNLITNGGFENAVNPTGSFYQDSDVAGWNAVDSASGAQLQIFNIAANGHQNVLELDSTRDQFDQVFQDVETRAGDTYILSFELREREVNTSADPGSNQVEVFWDGVSQGVFSATNHWQTVTLQVDGAADELSRLEFREVSVAASDGRGPMLDNVQLVKVSTLDSVINGGFETTPDTGTLFEGPAFSGWGAFGDSTADQQIRVETTGASEGNNYLSLDTGASRTDRIFQDVDTNSGEQYYLTFDLRGSVGQLDQFNEVRVRWNNQWAGTFQGTTEWQTFGLLVDASDVDTTRMVFREVARGAVPGGTGEGVQLDNIRLTQVGSFEPFAGVGALSEVAPADRNGIYTEAPPMTIDTTATYRATITVESGDEIDLLLYADRAPVTVNNFVNLAEDGWYDGLFFNRVVNDALGDPFVAQAGGTSTENTGGGPGYTFVDEIVAGLNFDSRNGLLAMANGGPNTNGSQFFITYGTPSFLNGLHTIFGEIELSDTDSFQSFNDLTFRAPGDATPADVITSVQITVV